MAQKIAELEKQKMMAEQERDKLSEQNTFLKNQYVEVSQEVNSLREQYTKSQQAKQAGQTSKGQKEHGKASSKRAGKWNRGCRSTRTG